MDWLFNPLPAPWQWVALFSGLLALGAAVILIPQMIWGKPHVKVMFETRDSKDKRYLECELFNLPVANRALRILHVYRRPIDHLQVFFSIKDIQTSEMMVTDILASIHTTQQNVKPMISVSLPASTTPAMIRLVNTRDNGITTAIDNYDAQNIELPAGEYCALIRIEASEEETEYCKNFFVGTNPEDLCWESLSDKKGKHQNG